MASYNAIANDSEVLRRLNPVLTQMENGLNYISRFPDNFQQGENPPSALVSQVGIAKALYNTSQHS